MRRNREGFTLIEVLISITLLTLVLMALYRSSDILRRSNKHLYEHLEKSSKSIQGNRVLYMDLLRADTNITINDEKKFHRLDILRTENSLYGQPLAHVTWLVSKHNHTLLRIEGNKYTLPLGEDSYVEVDPIVKNVELFKIYKNKKNSKLLILLQHSGRPVQSFMIQNRAIAKTKEELKRLPIPMRGTMPPPGISTPTSKPDDDRLF